MRYFRALKKVFTGRRPSIFTQYQPRNLQICIRFNSSLASQNSRGLFAQLDIAGKTADGRIAQDMEKVDTTERLARLREVMTKYKVDIYSM
jgi:hypothetical protein